MTLHRMPAHALAMGYMTAPSFTCAGCGAECCIDGWVAVPDVAIVTARAMPARARATSRATERAYYCAAPTCERDARAHAVAMYLAGDASPP